MAFFLANASRCCMTCSCCCCCRRRWRASSSKAPKIGFAHQATVRQPGDYRTREAAKMKSCDDDDDEDDDDDDDRLCACCVEGVNCQRCQTTWQRGAAQVSAAAPAPPAGSKVVPDRNARGVKCLAARGKPGACMPGARSHGQEMPQTER